jgi:RimJ/RimL family protein N-acetyltransferase
MHIERFDPVADKDKIRACYELYVAGKPADDPDGPLASLPVYAGWLGLGWDQDPREAWLVGGDRPGTWAGGYLLELPARENRHIGWLSIVIAPGQRRIGLGSELLGHAAARAAQHGRTVLSAETREDSPGSAFADAMGARRGVTEARRILRLADVPPGLLAELRRQAEPAARGYSLVSWRGAPPPEEYLDGVAAVANAMNDAPHSPGFEPEQIDAQRVRDSAQLITALGVRYYSVAARCDETGELAGLTQLAVDPLAPDWGHQHLTAVARAHRGHRLGLLVKVAMMELLAETEPGLERVITGNADVNQHMIAINEALGFRVLDRWPHWQLDVAQATQAAGSRAGEAAGARR